MYSVTVYIFLKYGVKKLKLWATSICIVASWMAALMVCAMVYFPNLEAILCNSWVHIGCNGFLRVHNNIIQYLYILLLQEEHT